MSTPIPLDLFTRDQADEFESAMQERQRQVRFEDSHPQEREHASGEEEMSYGSTPVPFARGLRSEQESGDDKEGDEDDNVKSSKRRSTFALVVALISLIVALYALYVLFYSGRVALQQQQQQLAGGAGAGSDGSFMRAVMRT
jgi:hypothetical protein